MTSVTAELESQTDSDSDQPEVESGSSPSYDDINTPVIVMVGVIATIVTVCTIFFVQGLTYQWENRFIRDRSLDFVNEPVRALIDDQRALLNGDTEKGIRPISETMSEVITEFGKSSAE